MNKLFKFCCFVLLIVFVFAFSVFAYESTAEKQEFLFNAQSLASFANISESPEISGKQAYVINLDTGVVVYEKNMDKKAYPASTVKLLTALVAYENIPDLDTQITISHQVVREASGSHMSLKEGEILTARELLYGVLMRGANDASIALALHVSEDIESFCKLMNDKAKLLGLQHSSFDNVTGFHSPDTYTTARDIAKIAKAVYYNDELFSMTNEKSHAVEIINKPKEIRTLLNRNTLISRSSSDADYYPGAMGMSLGGTPEGGQCVVSCYTTADNLTYLCVVLGAPDSKGKQNSACTDASEIFDFCKSSFALQTVASTSDVVCELKVNLASDTDHVTLFPAQDIKMLLPKELDFKNDIKIERRVYKESVKAPVYKASEFGEIVVMYKNQVVAGKTQLIAGNSVDRSNLLYFFNRIETFVFSTWFKVFVMAAAVLYGIYIALYMHSLNRNKRKGTRR